MKQLTVLFFLLITSSAHAQPWALFPQGQKSMYSLSPDEDRLQMVCADSLRPTAQGTVHYFFRNPYKDACRDAAVNRSYPQLPDHSEKQIWPDSVRYESDTAYVFKGAVMKIKIPLNMRQGDTVFLSPTKYLMLQVVAEGIVLGALVDSVKNFAIMESQYIVGSLTLSKTYGLINYPSKFFGGIENPEQAFLEGMNKDSQHAGLPVPSFTRFMPLFEAGDVRMYHRQNFEDFPSSTTHSFLRDSFTSAYHSPDSAAFVFIRSVWAHDTLRSKDTLSEIWREEDYRYSTAAPAWFLTFNGYLSHIYNTDEYKRSDDSVLSITMRSAGFFDQAGCSLTVIADFSEAQTITYRLGTTMRSSAGQSSETMEELIGYRLGGYTWGNIHTSVMEPGPDAYTFSLYPNPADNHLYISGAVGGNNVFTITDLQGRSHTRITDVQGRMNVADLSAGLYFLKLAGPHGSPVVKFNKSN
jgi:hypothetical protein